LLDGDEYFRVPDKSREELIGKMRPAQPPQRATVFLEHPSRCGTRGRTINVFPDHPDFFMHEIRDEQKALLGVLLDLVESKLNPHFNPLREQLVVRRTLANTQGVRKVRRADSAIARLIELLPETPLVTARTLQRLLAMLAPAARTALEELADAKTEGCRYPLSWHQRHTAWGIPGPRAVAELSARTDRRVR
jgi:hypothetical protein